MFSSTLSERKEDDGAEWYSTFVHFLFCQTSTRMYRKYLSTQTGKGQNVGGKQTFKSGELVSTGVKFGLIPSLETSFTRLRTDQTDTWSLSWRPWRLRWWDAGSHVALPTASEVKMNPWRLLIFFSLRFSLTIGTTTGHSWLLDIVGTQQKKKNLRCIGFIWKWWKSTHATKREMKFEWLKTTRPARGESVMSHWKDFLWACHTFGCITRSSSAEGAVEIQM